MPDSGVWRQQQDVLKARFPDLIVTSTYRPGAITATGNLSYHARGMAIDIAPRMEVFEWIRTNYPQSKELIFSPAGNRQIHNGAPHLYTGVTRANHFSHVHWAIEALAGGGSSNGDNAAPPADNPLIPDELEAVGQFYKFVTDPGIWVRIAMAIAGAALLIVALVKATQQ